VGISKEEVEAMEMRIKEEKERVMKQVKESVCFVSVCSLFWWCSLFVDIKSLFFFHCVVGLSDLA